ncbi:MAG: hypothetical protein KF860_13380 [Cyclobacteriaceae bacterium]|nr:hypothetical protein [Cyclobacteriaceae bacterium]
MKQAYMILLAVVMGSAPLFAQDKAPTRPADIGESEFDNFKNSSFNILEESTKLNANLKHIDEEIKEYSGVMSTVSVEKIKGHYKALTGVKGEVETINSNIVELDNKGKDMLANASKITPKMKSLKATANTKKSAEGLDSSKSNMKSIAQMLQDDMKLLGDELKSRGEPIE